MKEYYETPVTEVWEVRLGPSVLMVSGDNEKYGQGNSIGDDEPVVTGGMI